MIAQVVLSLLLGIVLLYAWAQYRRSPIVTVLSCAVSLIGFYFVWFPSHATRVAEFVGIGRGADLVLYVWACISLVVLLNLHLKLRTQHELLTQLARSIALANATLPEEEDARPCAPSRTSSLTEGQTSQPRYRPADGPRPGQTADQSA
jgi:small membrane protein